MSGAEVPRRVVRRRVAATRCGDIPTPFFMPDATRGSVRGIPHELVRAVGVVPMVVNTYHLMLAPGEAAVARAGGIHAFTGWDGPLLSDSGGYQVYSLIHRSGAGRITEDGARFRSVYDGTWRDLTPEDAVRIQADIGTDMMVVLDDPRPNEASHADLCAAVERTVRWAGRCRAAYAREAVARGWTADQRPLLFAVVQGGPDIALRRQCAAALADVARTVDDGFGTGRWDGMGFGGRHVDAGGAFMADVVAATAAAIPDATLAFALGIGTPHDIVRCAGLGWDMFDCVIPTREGRHGRVFLWDGPDPDAGIRVALENPYDAAVLSYYRTATVTAEAFAADDGPLAPGCDCGCAGYARSYLRHLTKVGDPLAATVMARHNLRFYMQLLARLRGMVE